MSNTSPNHRIVIGISTYNEIENLPMLVEDIDKHLPEAHLLIVDDNSPDGTGTWSQELAENREDVFCIRRAGKLGLGTATVATFQFAIDHGYDFVINMDADLSHRPEYLPQIVAAGTVPGVDVSLGSRYVDGGDVVGWPLHRKIMSGCVNRFAQFMLGLTTKDCSGSFRCYRVEKLKEISISQIRSKGYSFFEEILWRLRHANAHMVEVPIVFYDRERGASKINMREALRSIRILLSLAFSRPDA